MTYDYGDYSREAPAEGDLATLTNLAEQQKMLEDEVEDAQRALKAKQAELADISEHKIPELMDKVGLEKFATRGGLNIRISEAVRASIGAKDAPARRARNIAWLEDNGHDAIVKTSVVVTFGKGAAEAELARELAAELSQARGLQTDFAREVHAGSLSALVRELLEDGKPVPEDDLGVYRQRMAKVS